MIAWRIRWASCVFSSAKRTLAALASRYFPSLSHLFLHSTPAAQALSAHIITDRLQPSTVEGVIQHEMHDDEFGCWLKPQLGLTEAYRVMQGKDNRRAWQCSVACALVEHSSLCSKQHRRAVTSGLSADREQHHAVICQAQGPLYMFSQQPQWYVPTGTSIKTG